MLLELVGSFVREPSQLGDRENAPRLEKAAPGLDAFRKSNVVNRAFRPDGIECRFFEGERVHRRGKRDDAIVEPFPLRLSLQHPEKFLQNIDGCHGRVEFTGKHKRCRARPAADVCDLETFCCAQAGKRERKARIGGVARSLALAVAMKVDEEF